MPDNSRDPAAASLERDPAPGVGLAGAIREQVQRYAANRKQDAVRAVSDVAASVVVAARIVWLPVAWVLGWIGLVLSGLATSDEIALLLVPPVFAVLQSAPYIGAVTGAGRAEAARRRAVALPPAPVVEPVPRRNPEPLGSKVGLPDTGGRARAE